MEGEPPASPSIASIDPGSAVCQGVTEMYFQGAKALSERLAEVGHDPGRDKLRSEDPGSGSSSSCSDVLHDGEGESGDDKGRACQAV